jgi:hypothetical protein
MCCTLDLLIPMWRACCLRTLWWHCKLFLTTAEEVGLIALQGLPDLCTSCIVRLQIHATTEFVLCTKKTVALARKRNIPTERPPLVGEVSAQLLHIEGVTWSAQRTPTAVNLGFLDPEPLLFHSSSSSVILTRLSGPPFQTHYFPENLVSLGIEPRTSGSVSRNSDH